MIRGAKFEYKHMISKKRFLPSESLVVFNFRLVNSFTMNDMKLYYLSVFMLRFKTHRNYTS